MSFYSTTGNGGLDPLPCNTGVHRPLTGAHNPKTTPPWVLDWLRLSFSEGHVEHLVSLLQRVGFHPRNDRPKHGYTHGIGLSLDPLSQTHDCRIWYGGTSQNGRALIDAPSSAAGPVLEALRRSEIPFGLNRADFALDFDQVPFLSLQDVMLHTWETSWPYKGTKPRPYKVDDLGQGTGSTLYFGRRDGECMVRLYEKGKQLRDPQRPDWVRFEVEFKPQGDHKRAQAWSMLRRGLFHDLACSGFAAAFIPDIWGCAADRVFLPTPKTSKDFEDRVIAMLRQYGGLIGEMRERAGDDWEAFGEIIVLATRSIAQSKELAVRPRSAHSPDLQLSTIPF